MQRRRTIHARMAGFAVAFWLCLDASIHAQDVEALKAENESLRQQFNASEARLRQLRSELDDARAAAVQAKFQADAFEHQCKKLNDELARIKFAKPIASVRDDVGPKTQLTARVKPKPGQAFGKITAVGKDPSLLQISIGFDAGMREGQVLEVFRLAASSNRRSVYLGTLTLTRVDAQAAVGRFTSLPAIDTRPAVGDEVASDLFVK